MYIKIINPATNGKNAYSNKGSARQATNYLEGEAKKQGGPAVFFTSERADLRGDEAVNLIDSNRKGLRKNEAAFYSLVISPSARELEHIGHDRQKLQAFTARVMQEYAANFTVKSGKLLGEKELVWVATQHDERQHRGYDGAPSGQKKEGPQTHIHLMVSARDREQKITLNPLSSAARFNRVNFMAKGNVAFEQEFGPLKQAEKSSRSRGFARANAGQGAGSYHRRQHLTAEEMAESIRRRAAENQGRSARASTGYQRQMHASPAEELRDRQLFNQVDKVNKKLPTERQLDHNKVLEAARSQDYSKPFFGRLRQLTKAADKQRYHDYPYEFLRSGKDAKTAASTIAENQKKDKRLFDQVDRLNKKLPDEKKLAHHRVLEIAREQEYSQAFYGRLSRIGREAQGPKSVQEPYHFLRTGRIHRPESELNQDLPRAANGAGNQASAGRTAAPAPLSYQRSGARTVRHYQPSTARPASAMGHDLSRVLGTQGYTQDIRGDEERD